MATRISEGTSYEFSPLMWALWWKKSQALNCIFHSCTPKEWIQLTFAVNTAGRTDGDELLHFFLTQMIETGQAMKVIDATFSEQAFLKTVENDPYSLYRLRDKMIELLKKPSQLVLDRNRFFTLDDKPNDNDVNTPAKDNSTGLT